MTTNGILLNNENTVFHKENINQLDELYKVMLDLGLDSWRLVSIDPIGRANENNDLLLNGKEIRQLLDFIKSKKKDKRLEQTILKMFGTTSIKNLEIKIELNAKDVVNANNGNIV